MVQERDQRITQLEQELQHFQEDKAHQDEELESLQRKVDAANREAESLREELSNLGREFNRLLDDQSRMEQDTITQDMELKSKFENAESQKAASESELKTAKDQVAALKEETDRLRRHVQTLQQESADKEVKVANLEKQKAMAKSDIMGLNIALDSKQQELDLVSRTRFASCCSFSPSFADETPAWCPWNSGHDSRPFQGKVQPARLGDLHEHACNSPPPILSSLRFRCWHGKKSRPQSLKRRTSWVGSFSCPTSFCCGPGEELASERSRIHIHVGCFAHERRNESAAEQYD